MGQMKVVDLPFRDIEWDDGTGQHYLRMDLTNVPQSEAKMSVMGKDRVIWYAPVEEGFVSIGGITFNPEAARLEKEYQAHMRHLVN